MEWVRGETLGHGSFGIVSLAKPRNFTSDGTRLFAVKSCGVSQSLSLRNEKVILDELEDCPEIIRCYGESCTLEKGENLYNLFLEYASGGTLFDKLKNSVDHCLPENEVRRYTKGILKGLNYIHQNGYVHCDIKLQNILLNQEGSIKIGDFGLAKKVEEKKERNFYELRGTPMYMSPEMVVGGDHGSPADIWALGCLLVEMIAGSRAWKCSDLPALLMKIGAGNEAPEIPAKLSEEGKDFIRQCFIKDSERRWTAEMLLRHPFVAAYDHIINIKSCDANKVMSTSPRSAFEFSEWDLHRSSYASTTSPSSSPESSPDSFSWCSGESWSNSPAERLQRLVSNQEPNWSNSDDWISIRC